MLNSTQLISTLDLIPIISFKIRRQDRSTQMSYIRTSFLIEKLTYLLVLNGMPYIVKIHYLRHAFIEFSKFFTLITGMPWIVNFHYIRHAVQNEQIR